MTAERIPLDRPVIVEGKYDKNKLSQILDAEIITTEGFGLFKADEKKMLIRRLAAEKGVFVLTDSDSAGLLIRNHLNSILPKHQITHIYIPQIPGREKRKKEDSKEGLLGVEGIDADLLRSLFEPFRSDENPSFRGCRKVTKTDFYEDGLSGGAGSTAKRVSLAKKAGLPDNLSANALLEAINMLYSYDEYKELIK